MDFRGRMRSRSVSCRFWTESAQKMAFGCRKCAKWCQLHAFRDRKQNRRSAALAWAGWRVSPCCGWAARRTASVSTLGWYLQGPERYLLGAGFGRSVRSRSTRRAAWAWWAGSCVMRRVWVQPGCDRARPCSIARFRDFCWGRRERICETAVDSGKWIAGRGELPAVGCLRPVVGSGRNRGWLGFCTT